MKSLLLSFVMVLAYNALAFNVSVTAHVVDGDSGDPIPGFSMFITYGRLPRGAGCAPESLTFQRATNDDGICRTAGDTNSGKVTILTEDKRYYETWVTLWFTNYVESLKRIVPDHQDVTVRVWKVGQQIPLIVRRRGWGDSVDLFGKGNDVLRLDCMLGDYLPPVGTGVVADVEFRRKVDEKMDGDQRLKYHGEMTTTFLGDGNGLIEVEPNPDSRLKIRSGVDADFEKKHVSWIKEDFLSAEYGYRQYTTTNSYDGARCYCFRIRTMKDESGIVTNAFYGKIYGDIYFSQAYDLSRNRDAWTIFIARPKLLYYLNPTPMDKNLEFDCQHNLCPGQRGNNGFNN